MKTFGLIFILFLFISSHAQAQFKCVSRSGSCIDSNDYACTLSQRLWRQIKSLEDIWSTSLNIDFVDKNTVLYSSINNFCRHTGARGEKISQLHLKIIEDTQFKKKYQVIHSACGKDKAIVENFEIRGESLLPLDRKDIIFNLNRKFDLSPNEKFKDYFVTSENKTFVPYVGIENNFNPFNADFIFRTTAQKFNSINEDGITTEKIRSYFWLFDKQIFSQEIDKTLEKTKFHFKSPTYPFNYRLLANQFNSPCYESTVSISFEEFLLIQSSKSLTKYGLTFNDFVGICIQVEATTYVDEAEKILKDHISKIYPKFSIGGVVNRNANLQNDIEKLIRFIKAGNSELSLNSAEKFLRDVKSNQILDNR